MKHSDEYNYETVIYTKNLVEKIEVERGVIYDFFKENQIDFNRFLEEAMSLSDYRLKIFGKADLTKADFDEVLDLLVIEIDVEHLVDDGHMERFDQEDEDSKFFIPDQYAVDFMKNKYGVDLDVNKPFDYNLFYEKPDNPVMELLDKVCLN
jgi:hypothetical protein